MSDDLKWMQMALSLAKHAEEQGEVPVGAILVFNNQVIGEGWNQPISQCDPSAHAEIIALRNAAKQLQNYRLVNTTLYVTLEPCIMCAGAIIQARVNRLVYATEDPRSGAVESVFSTMNHPELNHKVDTAKGVLKDEASRMLKQFFQNKRLN